jgi:hypothetical protein
MSDELFRVVAIDAANAHHVASVFRAVYGEDFPARDVYNPEILWREIQAGRLMGALAFDAQGQPAGYTSLFTTAPNTRLWEVGNTVVVPAYAGIDVSLLLIRYFTDLVVSRADAMDGIFMEAVCSHYFTQVGGAQFGMIDCGLELDQLDGGSFKDGKSNRGGAERVSCVLSIREETDPPGPLYLPAPYDGILRKIMGALRPRRLLESTATLPAEGGTSFVERRYPAAHTWKAFATTIGADWETAVNNLLDESGKEDVISLQVTLNMACPPIGAAVKVLREKGFFFGGLAPRWFGTDGLLLQKVFRDETEYDSMKLYTSTAKELLAFIRTDRAGVQAGCAGER